jgi:hypothetical protein
MWAADPIYQIVIVSSLDDKERVHMKLSCSIDGWTVQNVGGRSYIYIKRKKLK